MYKHMYKFIIRCCEIYLGFCVPKTDVGFKQQLPQRVSQGTMAKFYRCDEQCHNSLCQIFSGFHISEVIKIGSFLTELLKLKMPSLFRNTVFKDRTGIDLLKEGIISEWTLGTISKGTSSGLL